MPAWLAALTTRKMLICVFTGFSSGLPLYLLLNLLPAWLRSEGVDLKTIGFFALIQFPYTWKFLWSPLLDRYGIPGFGRRRGWMLLTQIGLLLAIGFMGGLDPQENIWPILWLAAFLAFLSATQDIAVDAFRREILNDNELGLAFFGLHVLHSGQRRGGLCFGQIRGSICCGLHLFLEGRAQFLLKHIAHGACARREALKTLDQVLQYAQLFRI